MEDKIIIKTYYNDNSLEESGVLDLYSSIDVDFEVGPVKKINTGICISIPESFLIPDYQYQAELLLINIMQGKLSY